MARVDNILFIAPRFPEGPTVGGAETLIKHLAMQAKAAGRNATFLTTCARDHFTWKNELPAGSRIIDGIDVHFFPVDDDRDIPAFLDVQDRICSGIPVTADDEQTWLKNNVNSRAMLDYLREHGDEYGCIVMGPYLFGLTYFASKVHPSKTLLVPCLHDEAFAYLGAFREMFNSVRGFMFNAEPERDLAVKLYGLDRPVKNVVGIGLESFQTDGERFRRKHGITSPYLFYAGRREPMKGTTLLLDFFSAFLARTGRDLKLVFCGTGRIDVPSDIAASVVDVGFLTEEDKRDAMAGALAFCHPSVNESLGIVLLESWLAGTPGLVHGCSKVLKFHCEKGNAGLWFTTYPEFEEEVKFMMDNPAVRADMGNAGRAYVSQYYSPGKIRERLLGSVDGTLNG